MTVVFIVSILICCLSVGTLIISCIRLKNLEKKRDILENELKEWEAREAEARENADKYTLQSELAKGETKALQEHYNAMRENLYQHYKDIENNTKEKLDRSLEDLGKYYQEQSEQYAQNYIEIRQDFVEEMKDYGRKAQQLLEVLDDLKSKEHAAVEARKREMEKIDSINYYRVQIPEEDIKEVKKLREIIPQLRDPDALNKVIYKIYYENPVNDLIGRVVKNESCGIYKITNINNGMCYVGQTTNFANRWRQHIKRGVGAEPMTHNKLYPIMMKEGIENFTFEIIEGCPSNKLNEREAYWQDYFKAKEFGYSIK